MYTTNERPCFLKPASQGDRGRVRDFDISRTAVTCHRFELGRAVDVIAIRTTFARDSRAALAWFDAVVELVGRGDLRQARSHTIDECCSTPLP